MLQPAQPRSRRTAYRLASTDNGNMAVFDVCGSIFKVPAKIVHAQPETLLAKLLREVSEADPAAGSVAGKSKPIFVDADPSRFKCILDWYRYGEMHIPRHIPVTAVLMDASRLDLPDEIIVNGTVRVVDCLEAQDVARDTIQLTISGWVGFRAFLNATLDAIRSHFHSVAEKSAFVGGDDAQDADESYDFSPFLLALFGEKGWLDDKHVCSAARARVLALKIEERGYRCEFSETELVVMLPVQLKGESYQGGHAEDGPPDEEEDMYEDGECEEGEAEGF